MISIKVSSHDTMRLYISKEIEEKREEKALRAKKEEGALDFIADVITLKRKKILVFYNEASSFTLLYNRPEKSNYKNSYWYIVDKGKTPHICLYEKYSENIDGYLIHNAVYLMFRKKEYNFVVKRR